MDTVVFGRRAVEYVAVPRAPVSGFLAMLRGSEPIIGEYCELNMYGLGFDEAGAVW